MKTQAAITILLLLASTLFVQAQSTQSIPNSTSATVRTDLDICVEQKTNKYVSDMKIASFAVLMNTEQLQKKAQFTAECSAESQKAAQQKAIAAQQAAATAAANSAASNSGSGSSGAASTAAAGTAGVLLARQIVQALPDSKTTAAPQAQPSSTSAPSSAASAGASASTAAPAVSAASTTPSPAISSTSLSNTSSAGGEGLNSAEAAQQMQSTHNQNALDTDYGHESRFFTSKDPDVRAAAADAESANAQIGAAASDAKTAIPDLSTEADKLVSNAGGGGAQPPATDITSAATSMDGGLQQAAQAFVALQGEAGGFPIPYPKTIATLGEINTKILSYISTTKKACVASAESTEFLCLEGTSPGAIAAKNVMNIAGPVLAVLNSAQKACSGTAKVTNLVSKGLTVAKGACVAAKLACDGACSLAASSYTALYTMASTQLRSSLQADYAAARAECIPEDVGTATAPCSLGNNAKFQMLLGKLTPLQAKLQPEKVPATPGTTPNIALRCQSHMKDILLFAVNLAGLMQSKKSAESCEKTLAASGNTGVTPAQYCENTANAATQFCVCQKNNTATGCPGAIANSLTPTNTDPSGTNIKSTAGTSAFASGFKPTAVSGGLNKNALGGLGSTNAGVGGAGTDGAATAGTGSGSDFSSGGQGSAGANAPGGAGGDEKTASSKGASDKKWNFGSLGEFGSSLGGLFGGKSGSDKNGNGALNQKQVDAIKRQIASEQRSAQVSSATGKSNWEKVQQRYLMNSSSFLNGR